MRKTKRYKTEPSDYNNCIWIGTKGFPELKKLASKLGNPHTLHVHRGGKMAERVVVNPMYYYDLRTANASTVAKELKRVSKEIMAIIPMVESASSVGDVDEEIRLWVKLEGADRELVIQTLKKIMDQEVQDRDLIKRTHQEEQKRRTLELRIKSKYEKLAEKELAALVRSQLRNKSK